MVPHTKTVAFIFAHPDDETFGTSALCQVLDNEGIQKVLLMATPGDAGRAGLPAELKDSSPDYLGRLRKDELSKIAQVLNIQRVKHLDHSDGHLIRVLVTQLQQQIEEFINEHKPQIVVSFPPDGVTHHPDHVVLSVAVRLAMYSHNCPSVKRLFSARLGGRKEAEKAPYVIDTQEYWETKRLALETHYTQKYTVEKFFGDLSEVKPDLRYEIFNFEWAADGKYPRRLDSLFDEQE